ncbi:MAG: hypothetical protein JHC54_05745 [Acinetobacter sp.]|nr:hypothetical protein [Acinetobacter sp.]
MSTNTRVPVPQISSGRYSATPEVKEQIKVRREFIIQYLEGAVGYPITQACKKQMEDQIFCTYYIQFESIGLQVRIENLYEYKGAIMIASGPSVRGSSRRYGLSSNGVETRIIVSRNGVPGTLNVDNFNEKILEMKERHLKSQQKKEVIQNARQEITALYEKGLAQIEAYNNDPQSVLYIATEPPTDNKLFGAFIIFTKDLTDEKTKKAGTISLNLATMLYCQVNVERSANIDITMFDQYIAELQLYKQAIELARVLLTKIYLTEPT